MRIEIVPTEGLEALSTDVLIDGVLCGIFRYEIGTKSYWVTTPKQGTRVDTRKEALGTILADSLTDSLQTIR